MRYLFLFLLVVLSTISCRKYNVYDDPINGVFLELATSELNPSYRWPYLYYYNGFGDSTPVETVESDSLPSHGVYNGKLSLVYSTGNPNSSSGRTLHQHFIEMGSEHQVFYEVSDSLDLNIVYNDFGCNGRPIGFEILAEVGEPSSGTLTINLLRNPNKSAEGVASGNIQNAGGTIHYSHTFDVAIK